MSETTESKKPGWMNLTTFILAMAAYAGGFVTNYTARYSQVDQAITAIGALSVDFKNFLKEYNASHEETAVSIKALNQHLEYTDGRLKDLEQIVAARRP